MYCITEMNDGRWWCQGRIQDGTETWWASSKKEAIQSLIKFARVMNHVTIITSDINIMKEEPKELPKMTLEEFDLLNQIKSGSLVCVRKEDPRLKYKLSREEYELIVAIREGDKRVVTCRK